MDYLLIPDKFKGSLRAQQVIDAIGKGIREVHPEAVLHSAVLSDGGDGFLDSIDHYGQYNKVVCKATNPLGKNIEAYYLYDQDSQSAYIEMAQTAGLVLLKESERDPMLTSTFGVGMQIKHALEKGAKQLFIGLGGSATNDAGIGIAVAMGYRFLDAGNRPLEPIGKNLSRIVRIQKPKDDSAYANTKIFAVNDVNNPLYGPNGAAHIYAAQKGASKEEISLLDRGMRDLEALMKMEYGISNATVPGTGAAGGTAYGLMSFLGAQFVGGTEFVLGVAGVNRVLTEHKVDYIITGEGKIDDQTLSGKLIHGIMELGRTHKIPVIAVCGILDTHKDTLLQQGLNAVIEVSDRSQSLSYNMENAAALVEQAVHHFFIENDKV